MIEAWTRQLTRDEAISILRAKKIAAAPVRDVAEVMEDPHMHSRGMLSVEHPTWATLFCRKALLTYQHMKCQVWNFTAIKSITAKLVVC